MPLVTMKSILDKARENHYAVLATNMLSLEMVLGGIQAAEQLNSPLILQLAPVQFNTTPLDVFGPLMVSAAKMATVPIAVHLDHGTKKEDIFRAIDLGFTSVMFDGSSLSLLKNIEITREITEYAHNLGITVEAEIGYVGNEDEDVDTNIDKYRMTQPSDVVEFVNSTNCDALAVAIGNAHGLYTSRPNLQFDLLYSINTVSEVPLVLHGGSGTQPNDLEKCVLNGICKVNLASEIHFDYVKKANDSQSKNYLELSKKLTEATQKKVSKYINILGSKGRA